MKKALGSPRYLLKSSGKIQAKTPQEVKTTPSQDGLDLVKGLKRSGRALHAPKLPRSAGIPDSLTTSTAARRVAFARFASLRSIDDSGRGLRPRTIQTTPSRKKGYNTLRRLLSRSRNGYLASCKKEHQPRGRLASISRPSAANVKRWHTSCSGRQRPERVLLGQVPAAIG